MRACRGSLGRLRSQVEGSYCKSHEPPSRRAGRYAKENREY